MRASICCHRLSPLQYENAKGKAVLAQAYLSPTFCGWESADLLKRLQTRRIFLTKFNWIVGAHLVCAQDFPAGQTNKISRDTYFESFQCLRHLSRSFERPASLEVAFYVPAPTAPILKQWLLTFSEAPNTKLYLDDQEAPSNQ